MTSLWIGLFLIWLLPGVVVVYGLRGWRCLMLAWLCCGVLACFAYLHWGNAAGLKKAMLLSHQVNSIQHLWKKDSGASVIARIECYGAQHPKDAKAWYWLARLQWRRGHMAEAKVALSKALRLQPHNPLFITLRDMLQR